MRPSDRPVSAPRPVGSTSAAPHRPRARELTGAAGALALAALSARTAVRLLGPDPVRPAPLPTPPEADFSDAEIAAGRAFARPQRRLGGAGAGLELVALGLLARRVRAHPPGTPAARSARGRHLRCPGREATARTRALGAGVAAGGLSLATTLIGLPTDALARQRALSVGLSTQSWRAWSEDLIKATALEAGLSAILAGGSSLLASRVGRRWWLPAAGGIVGVSLLAGLLAPVLTDPLFNAFTPMEDGELRTAVLELARRAEVDVGEVFVVDASRRTTAVNAYVNGLGPTKRVVLFDTLLSGFSHEEILSVVAHELGHVRHHDVWRLTGFLAISAPAALLAVQELTRLSGEDLAAARALPALSLALSISLVPTALGGAALSRAIERRTDRFGLTLSGAPEATISFFRTIALQNRADVTAPGWLGRRLASHPPITERIGAARAVQQAQAH